MNSDFTITFLGTGTGVPRKSRQAPGLVVRMGSTPIILDSGSGSIFQLVRAGFRYYEIDHLFYSHYAHPDHINDLSALIFANQYFDPIRKTPLYIFGPPGIKDFFQRLIELYPLLGKTKFPIKVYELTQEMIRLNGDTIIKTDQLNHQGHACLGYRIEYSGKVLVYSGDTDYCENLINLAQEAEVLIIECSFPNEYKVAGHLIPREIASIATQAEVKKVILTHLYPYSDQVDVVAQVKEKFRGEVFLARDLMEVVV